MKTEGCDKIRVLICCDANVTIDWGDGVSKSEPYKIDTLRYYPEQLKVYYYEHIYSTKSTYTVIITENNITYFHCGDNNLTYLDVSKKTSLKYLICSRNQLTKLDVYKNTALKELFCIRNQLTHLNVSKNTSLEYLSCDSNQFSTAALNSLFETLHGIKGISKYIDIFNNPGTDACNKKIAEDKGWRVE
jgi:hypothetical protein